jgi:hypothetical protein
MTGMTAAPSGSLYDVLLGQSQLKHAVKTGLACCMAAGLSYLFRTPSSQLAPAFAFLLMTTGMPSPQLNWLLTQLALVVSAGVSAVLLLVCRDAPILFLAVTLLWIFTCLLFSNWCQLPATLGAMLSALGIFSYFQGTVGGTFQFYVNYQTNFLIAGFSVVVLHTLLWHWNTRKLFLQRLAAVYARLESHCRHAAQSIRSGAPADDSSPAADDLTPFRALRQLVAPELRRGLGTSNPFARMILACRSLNLRLWFFNRAVAPQSPVTLGEDVRRRLADRFDRCADHLHGLLEALVDDKQVPPMDSELLSDSDSIPRGIDRESGDSNALIAHGVHTSILRYVVRALAVVTAAHHELRANLRDGLAGELKSLGLVTADRRLLDVHSLRSSTKLVVILALLLFEEAWLGFPGGSQVAFYATFFASTGNLGRQNKTDVVGLLGLMGGFAYGVVAAFLTSRMPHFPLLLILVFLGEMVACLIFQRLPRYSAAGLQAGLALVFAFLASPGPEWGSFSTVRTRFWGLVVAGCTAVLVHAYLWPTLPMRQLRASIAAALRDTAASLKGLFGLERAAWDGAPPSLAETVTRARDLLDDARYLPGPDHADPAYEDILHCLQEIDASLEFVHFLVRQETEHPLPSRFFRVLGDYADQARDKIEQLARQFDQPSTRSASQEPIRWDPCLSDRWERSNRSFDAASEGEIDPRRLTVIADCLDKIAMSIVRIAAVDRAIDPRVLEPSAARGASTV